MQRGEFIKFLDSDDTMDPDVLEILYNTAKEQCAKIVCGEVRKFKDGDNHTNVNLEQEIQCKNVTVEEEGIESVAFKYTVGRYTCYYCIESIAWSVLYRKQSGI